MVIDIAHEPRPRKASAHPATWNALRELPVRKPEKPSPRAAEVRWELVDSERYEVHLAARVVGYIDVVGAVFVVLEGGRYDHAVEVLQTLVFEDAVAALTRGRVCAI